MIQSMLEYGSSIGCIGLRQIDWKISEFVNQDTPPFHWTVRGICKVSGSVGTKWEPHFHEDRSLGQG